MTTTMIINYIIRKFFSLGFFSFIANFFLLILIKKNIFGSKIKNLVEDIPKNTKNMILIFIHYFVFVYILIFLIKYNLNTIYLDTVKVNVVVNGVKTDITGDILTTAREVFGDTAVFLGCARLAYLITAKNTGLSGFSKIVIVIGGGTGGYTSYRVIKRTASYLGEQNTLVLNGNLRLENVVVSTSGNYQNIPEHPVLNLLFGMNAGVNFNNVQQSFSTIKHQGQTVIQGVGNGFIDTLNNQNPNWKEQFQNYTPSGNPYSPWTINSPYESETGLISFLIDNLTDHLYIVIISTYLLLMLLLIFICKLILSPDMEFKRISKIKIFKWSLGEKIAKLLIWFVSIWQRTSNFWIFFIITILIIFNGVFLFSIYVMLKILKNISNI